MKYIELKIMATKEVDPCKIKIIATSRYKVDLCLSVHQENNWSY